jgi:hypothetical protein
MIGPVEDQRCPTNAGTAPCKYESSGACNHEFQKRAGRNSERSPQAVVTDLLPQQSARQPLSPSAESEDLDKRALERTVRRNTGWKARHLTIQRDVPFGKNCYASGLMSGDEFVYLSKGARALPVSR